MKKYSNKKIISIIVMLAALGSNVLLSAKVRAIKGRRDFEQALATQSMVVALFYKSEKGNRDNKGLTRMYDDLSAYKPYDDADVIFLKVNIARKDLADLATLYNVTDIPSFIFFNNGRHLLDENGLPVALNGFVSRADLQIFIDDSFKEEISACIAAKELHNQRILEQENESWKPYYYPRDILVRDYDPAVTKYNLE